MTITDLDNTKEVLPLSLLRVTWIDPFAPSIWLISGDHNIPRERWRSNSSKRSEKGEVINLLRTFVLAILATVIFAGTGLPQSKVEPLFFDNFQTYLNGSDGSPIWYPTKGQWQIVDGEYCQKSHEYDCGTMINMFLNQSFVLEAKFRQIDGEAGAGFFFHAEDYTNTDFAYMFRLDGTENMLIGYFQNGGYNATVVEKIAKVDPKEWHHLKLVVDKDNHSYSVYLDGKPVAVSISLTYSAGYWGLQSSGGHVHFDEVKLTRLPMKATLHELNWPRHFVFNHQGEIIIPNKNRRAVQVFDEQGNLLKEFGAPSKAGRAKGPLHRPWDVAVLRNGDYVVTDVGMHRLHFFDADGKWKDAVGWRGTGKGQFNTPVAVAADSNDTIFVVDQGNDRVQVFTSDLKFVVQFGKDKLDRPTDIAIDHSKVYVLNLGKNRVELFQWSGQKAQWIKSIKYGAGQARGIAVIGNRIWVTVGDEVRLFNRDGALLSTFKAQATGSLYPWGVAIDSENRVCIADFTGGKIVVTDSSLLDPVPEIHFPKRKRAVIEWKSSESQRAQLVVTKGGEVIADQKEKSPKRRHQFVIDGLDLATNYHFQIKPTLRAIPPSEGFSKKFTFITPAPKGQKYYWRLPVAVLLFANVIDEKKQKPDWPELPPLSDAEIQRIEAQIRDGALFYWVNSHMNFYVDVDFVVVRDFLKRSELFGEEWYFPPRDGMVEKYLQRVGKNINDYRGILYMACIRDYEAEKGRYVLRGRGGAFTDGINANHRYGISWWEVTHRNHNAGNNWLMVHEFHHQVDELFLNSGHPEYWSNHFSPTINTAADFGEHFDGNAWILRHWPTANWYDLKYGNLVLAKDSDEDGIPDDAPELPLDEIRLHSNPGRKDTDGDGLTDLEELRFSNWVVEGWGETYGKALFPNLSSKDTDGDGLIDGQDPYPTYDAPTEIGFRTPKIDGKIEQGEWNFLTKMGNPRIDAAIFCDWDDKYIYFAISMSKPLPFKIQLDADADGWFVGRDNYIIKISPVNENETNAEVQINNAAEVKKWPFFDKELAQKVKLITAFNKQGKNYCAEIAIPKDENTGIELFSGERVGFNIGFQVEFDEESHKRYLTVFEPNSFFKTTLVR